MLVLAGAVGLHRPGQLWLLLYPRVSTDLDVELFALETNQDHAVLFEIAPKYCISGSS